MTMRGARPGHPDAGASLVLAIGFVLMIGLVSGGLIGLATSGLNNRNTLQLVRNRQYAADGAIEQAIAKVRAATCTPTNGSLSDSSLNGISIRVDWVTDCTGTIQSPLNGTILTLRNVIFSAYECVGTGATCDAAKVIIRAQVNYQEGVGGAVAKTYVLSWSVNQ